MKRLIQLDALRAFAVLGVILHHSVHWSGGVPLGPYAVRLFFVLSGFLITGILLRAREKSADRNRGYTIRSFYARRFLRIFPVYYAALAVLILLGQPEIGETVGWHVSYLSNVLASRADVDIQPIWGHLWSLSVEEQFYLLWPALVLFLPRRWLPAAFLSAVAFGPAFRLFAGVNYGVKPAVYLTPGCLDSLGLGAFLAWLASRQKWERTRDSFCRWALFAGMLLIAATAASVHWDISWRLWLLARDLGPALVFCWLVNRAANGFQGWPGKLLEYRPLVYVGTISYGMYLFHNFIPWLCQTMNLALPGHGFTRFLVLAPLTTALAAASWHLFEKPLNDLKDRFPYVRRQQADIPVPAMAPDPENVALGTVQNID